MLASKRGYIWSRSIPLMFNNILIGKGAETFVYQFPQNDFLGKLQVMKKTNQVIQKPHNMYLQIAINFGFLTLIIFMFILIRYYYKSFIKDKKDLLNLAIIFSLLAYLIAGLFNDTIIINNLIFWMLFAIGFSKTNK